TPLSHSKHSRPYFQISLSLEVDGKVAASITYPALERELYADSKTVEGIEKKGDSVENIETIVIPATDGKKESDIQDIRLVVKLFAPKSFSITTTGTLESSDIGTEMIREYQRYKEELIVFLTKRAKNILNHIRERYSHLLKDGDVFRPECVEALQAVLRPLLFPPGRLLEAMVPFSEGLDAGRMFDAISNIIVSLSAVAPVVIFLDDMHWADEQSCELMQYISRLTRKEPILLICTYRPEELGTGERTCRSPLARTLMRMSRERLHKLLELYRLEKEHVLQMITSIFRFIPAVPAPELVEEVFSATEVLPFFVEEYLKALWESGGINIKDMPGLKRLQRNPDVTVAMPEAIRDVVLRRLSSVPPEMYDVLQTAALIGENFDYDVLKMSMNIDENSLLEMLDHLSNRAIIKEVEDFRQLYKKNLRKEGTPRQPILLEPSDSFDISTIYYTFNHTMIHEAIKESMSHRVKIVLHQRIAKACMSLYKKSPYKVLFDLANHTYYGGLWKEALYYNLISARKAEEAESTESAIRFYKQTAVSISNLLKDSLFYDEESLAERLKSISVGNTGSIFNNGKELTFLDPGVQFLYALIFLIISSSLSVLNQIEQGFSYSGLALYFALNSLNSYLQGNREFPERVCALNDKPISYKIQHIVGKSMETFNFEEMTQYLDCLLPPPMGPVVKKYLDYGLEQISQEEIIKKCAEALNEKTSFGKLLGQALVSCGRYLYLTSKIEMSEKLLKYSSRMFELIQDSGGIDDSTIEMARLYYRTGRYDEAIKVLENQLNNPDIIHPALQAGRLRRQLANILSETGRVHEAINHSMEAVKIFQDGAHHRELPATFNTIAVCYYYLRDYRKAAEAFEEAASLASRVKNRKALAFALSNAAEMYALTGEPLRSLAYLEKASDLFASMDDTFSHTLLKQHYGIAYREAGDYEKAEIYFSDVEKQFEKEKNPYFYAATFLEHAKLYIKKGDRQNALRYLNTAKELMESLGQKNSLTLKYMEEVDQLIETLQN
ncbi:MAG: tetratricopeptide repeat protein, partial [Thermoplasmata archaeon]